jgi:hypothetical protein
MRNDRKISDVGATAKGPGHDKDRRQQHHRTMDLYSMPIDHSERDKTAESEISVSMIARNDLAPLNGAYT